MIDLSEHRKNIFQNHGLRECPHYGEDGVILKIFEEIGVSKKPYCIEFGELRVLGTTTRSYRIFYKARSLYFSYSYDFRSFYLNIIDIFKVSFIKKSFGYLKFLFNLPSSYFITTSNVEDIFKKNKVPTNDLDLITVDIDSSDYYVIKQILELGYLPKLFIVEYNPSFGLNKKLSCPNDAEFKPTNLRLYGASYKALDVLMSKHNYSLCFVSGFSNLFYIRDDFSSRFKIPEIENEFTDTEEKINAYIKDHCQEGFIPSWMHSPKLSEADFLLLDSLEESI